MILLNGQTLLNAIQYRIEHLQQKISESTVNASSAKDLPKLSAELVEAFEAKRQIRSHLTYECSEHVQAADASLHHGQATRGMF